MKKKYEKTAAGTIVKNFGIRTHDLKQLKWMLKWNSIGATVMILSFRTDRPGQTVQTQIRLLLEEQSDQGLHCMPFRLHRLDSLLYGKST